MSILSFKVKAQETPSPDAGGNGKKKPPSPNAGGNGKKK